MPGSIVALGIAPAAAAPIEAVKRLRVEVARGPVGDRYAHDTGTFKGHPDQEVTLVEAEDAEAVGVAPLELRRNVVTRGIALTDLIGRTFRAGDALLHGIRVCLPCGHLERHLARPGLKAELRGGLRARVVKAGEMSVGDTVEPVPVHLDADMRAVVEAARLGFVATVTPEGRPNLSPKGTMRLLDERRVFFLDLASPQTRKNLATNPWMEINVIDALSRRGYRFLGQATLHKDGPLAEAAKARIFADEGAEFPTNGVVILEVERALPILSPGYQHVETEEEMRAMWKPRRASLDAAFEEHLAQRET